MDKRAKEKQQEDLHVIQVDLANYIYNNFEIYTKDEEKVKEGKRKYNQGKGVSTEQEYISDMKNARIYSEIEKVEFTGFSVGPMNNLEAHYTINDVINKETSLDTISAETNKFLYGIGEHSGEGPYYLEKKKNATNLSIPDDLVVYYHGGID